MCRTHPWLRLPGLFRRFEFGDVIAVDREFYVEVVGEDDVGVSLYAIYYRPRPGGEPASAHVPRPAPSVVGHA